MIVIQGIANVACAPGHEPHHPRLGEDLLPVLHLRPLPKDVVLALNFCLLLDRVILGNPQRLVDEKKGEVEEGHCGADGQNSEDCRENYCDENYGEAQGRVE